MRDGSADLGGASDASRKIHDLRGIDGDGAMQHGDELSSANFGANPHQERHDGQVRLLADQGSEQEALPRERRAWMSS